MSNIDIEALKAQLREEMEAQIRAEVTQEIEDRASKALSIADICEARNSVAVTVQKVLDAAGVRSINGKSRFKLYDRDEVRKAFIQKDRNILKYHGLLHMVEGADLLTVATPVEVVEVSE